jgi:F-type H+-transporting ATPase subunit delta
MAELTTIARPYAQAAFSLAQDGNALPAWSEALRLAEAVVTDAKVAAALDNPRLTADDKTALLLSICGDKLDIEQRNFLRVLVEADRIVTLPQIRGQFLEFKDGAEGVAKARIDSAFALSDAQIAELTGALEKRFGRRIDATVNVDPTLIGGVRITVGDTVVDGTVQAQLHAMARDLRAKF